MSSSICAAVKGPWLADMIPTDIPRARASAGSADRPPGARNRSSALPGAVAGSVGCPAACAGRLSASAAIAHASSHAVAMEGRRARRREAGSRAALSVQARVGWHAREQRIAPSLAREDGAPQLLRQPREDVLGHRRVGDPVAVIHLCVELAPAPAREAGEHALARGRLAELLDVGVVGGEADPPQDDQPRRVRVLELGQHDYRPRLDGPTEVDEVACADRLLELRYGLADSDLGCAVEHDATGAFLVWTSNQHHRTDEVR